jgi:hypothetical protein
MNAHLQTAFAGIEAIAWHETRAAQNILRNIHQLNAPVCTVTFQRGLHEDRHVIEYDREDARVLTLHAVANTWFQMAEDYTPLLLAPRWMTVDEAISAAVDAAIAREERQARRDELFEAGLSLGEVEAILAGMLEIVGGGE